ncbi:MAG: fused MFS/spermidine synthase [Polyangiales bacterium]
MFGSGLCALIDQVVWTRELRLVFGASTAASSAVVAIFIAGLGFGGLWFGRRVEQSDRPLRFYALLELAVGVTCALTPWLLDLVRALYVWSGGSPQLGPWLSNLVRLVFAALVLLPPTFLMGGTLPALARTLEAESDRSRRAVAIAYAVNTLGAVVGALLTTFVLLEQLGNRRSLYSASCLNVLIGGLAYLAGRAPVVVDAPAADGGEVTSPAAPRWFVFASAAVVGCAFFLMELVWYRVLGPLLGGSVFTFGLILGVALAGIGVGSALYAGLGASRQRMWLGFALSCAAEALCIAVPYALGDRLAMSALFLQSFSMFGFHGLVLGWSAIAVCVVFPAALVSGLQFPLLIALLGAGRTGVARDVGQAYAANTVGAIAGALAGGFGLLPLLGALGCWRAVTILLAGWSVLATVLAVARQRSWRLAAPSVSALLLCAASLACLGAVGPTAVLRHSPIGVGRVELNQFDGPNSIASFYVQERRSVDWETDGIESAVAITHYDGVSFIVNGKSDGSALTDAPTQIMSGLLGAALVPHPKRALVIGLGTGSTAGWLAKLPEIERVDVAEIEPVISQVAKRCAPVNQDALNNPKLHVVRGDARELLAVLRSDYDVIFSEPSNPYRAGIASMYAREMYEAVKQRLRPNGLFVQWLQAYDVDASSVRTIYATLGSVFPHIETWNGLQEDLLLVASREPPVHDVGQLRARLAEEPYRSALRKAWFTEDIEGFFAHYVANDAFTRAAIGGEIALNTDDLSPVEFGFARAARGGGRYSSASILSSAEALQARRPALQGGTVDWARSDYEREAFATLMGSNTAKELVTPPYQTRLAMLSKWANGDLTGALALWNIAQVQGGSDRELGLNERLVRAELLAYEGSIESERLIEGLLADRPTEAAALHAVYLLRHGQRKAGTALMRKALLSYRSDPWPYPLPIARALAQLQVNDAADRELAQVWLDALSHPFALRVNETARERAQLRIALGLGVSHPACVRVFEGFEPYPPWTETLLQFRSDCYEAHSHRLREQAARDLARFRDDAPVTFDRLLTN